MNRFWLITRCALVQICHTTERLTVLLVDQLRAAALTATRLAVELLKYLAGGSTGR